MATPNYSLIPEFNDIERMVNGQDKPTLEYLRKLTALSEKLKDLETRVAALEP